MDQPHSQLAKTLATSLRLAQPPVAVSFSDSIPAFVPTHKGQVAAGCQFWREAVHSPFVTSPGDHALCAVGSYTHNFDLSAREQSELQESLAVFGSLGYVQPEDLPLIPVLNRRPAYVVYAPLAQSPLSPDVVLLFCDASQALIVSEAVQQVEHRNPPAMGRPACAVIPQVANTGHAALSFGCCGARAYNDTFAPELVLCALPGANLTAYVERTAVLSVANSVLSRFHHQRARDVATGATPTVKESLASMNASAGS